MQQKKIYLNMLVKEIQEKFPIHYLVWKNEFQELEKLLKENKVN